MSTLYQLTDEMQRITDALIEAGGEVTPETESLFDGLSEQIERKIDSTRAAIRNLEAEAEAAKAEEDYFKARRVRAENSVKAIKANVLRIAELRGLQRIEGSTTTCTVREATSSKLIVHTMPTELPERFQKRPAVEVDTRALKEAVQRGDPDTLGHAELAPRTKYVMFR